MGGEAPRRTLRAPFNKIDSFELSDGTSIPWLAWGNGSAVKDSHDAIEKGVHALKSGIDHIDTAELYQFERETGEAIEESGVGKDRVYVTSKLGWDEDGKPIALNTVRSRIEITVQKLGFIPDLFLIHNPHVVTSEDLVPCWKILEELKDEGQLKSIGVSNFRPQDLNAILSQAKHKPVVNQIEYHPFVLSHLAPVLAIHEQHGIRTEAFGPLTPLLRHSSGGGPLVPVLQRIAERLASQHDRVLDSKAVLLLWTRAMGAVAVSASKNPERIKWLAEVAKLPEDLLTDEEVNEITEIGKKFHFRHYTEHMEVDFPVPNLPSQ
ncbi:hypothetical protein Agabi119p4_2262 [Agaricus bisporus var. burnettii]|uniref:NADP-dependent oxidoreductase domain-containing protein n=1 Tax=Agaricus bisporus var. burnettii TaxID=192524 RepID=A0A8H7F8Q9_AGABI|nr:hypothetical protein Agabi119p4_2262 [Agaricus bisporus var. burnettii]